MHKRLALTPIFDSFHFEQLNLRFECSDDGEDAFVGKSSNDESETSHHIGVYTQLNVCGGFVFRVEMKSN